MAGQFKSALSGDANYVIEGAGEDAKLLSLRSGQVHTLNTKVRLHVITLCGVAQCVFSGVAQCVLSGVTQCHELTMCVLCLVQTYKCDCTFAQTLLLPCRHAMFYRKTNGNESVLPPFSLLCPRWLRAHPLNNIREGPVYTGEFEYHSIDSAESVAPVVAPVK